MTNWNEIGKRVAIECGYEHPTSEEIAYFARIEKWGENRARRGIPISAP